MHGIQEPHMPKGYARDDGMMGIYSDHTLVPWKSGRADSRLVENKTGRVFYEIDATAVNLNALTILGYVAVDGIIYASVLSKNWLGRSHFPFRREEGSMGCKESNGCRSSNTIIYSIGNAVSVGLFARSLPPLSRGTSDTLYTPEAVCVLLG